MSALITCLLALLAAPASQAAPNLHLTAYVITLGPGDEPWEKFGHNMIFFRDDADLDIAYNWGMFDFDEPHFLWHFVEGKLMYWMEGFPSGIIGLYVDQDRTVTAQRLNLSPQETQKLYDLCVVNARDENRLYLYDYFKNNCSTKVRDTIDLAVDGQLRQQLAATPTPITFRSETSRLTAGTPWLYAGLYYIIGQPIDRPLTAWNECFIPARLHDRLTPLTITENGATRPLVAEERVIHVSGRPPLRDQPPRWLAYFLGAGILIGISCLLPAARLCSPKSACSNRWLRRLSSIPLILWIFLSAFAGSFCLYMWFLTDHAAIRPNENVLQLSPLALPLLITLPLALRRGGRWAKIAIAFSLLCAVSSALGLVLKVLPAMNQVNANMIALALPANVGMALGVWRLLRCEIKPSLPSPPAPSSSAAH